MLHIFIRKIIGTTMNVNRAPTFLGTILIVIALCVPTLCLNLPDAPKYVKFKSGKSSESTGRPISRCVRLPGETLQFNCTVRIQQMDDKSGFCHFIITPERGMNDIEIDLVYQLHTKKVLFLWEATSGKPEAFSRSLQIIDTNNCEISHKSYFPRFSHDWRNLEKLIIYEDGFETIFTDIQKPQGDRKKVSLTVYNDGREEKISVIPSGLDLLPNNADRKIKDVIVFEIPSAELEKSILQGKDVKPSDVQT